MRGMGLDVGDRRIGVAVSDALGMMARPLTVVERSGDTADCAAITSLAQQYDIQYIIVGLPRSLNGSIGPQAEKVQTFAEGLRRCIPIKIEFRDERLSTVSAKRMLREGGKRKGEKKKGEFDAAAAAIILQVYLDELHLNRNAATDGGGFA